MVPDEYKRWVERLTELSPEQLKNLADRMKHGLDMRLAPKLDEDWLLVGLCASMRDKGVLANAALPGLLKSSSAKAYGAVSASLRADLEKLLPSPHSRDRVALARLVGDSLIKYLEITHVPVTAGSILVNAQHAMVALNRAFPGYIQAHMIHLLLNGALHEQRTLQE